MARDTSTGPSDSRLVDAVRRVRIATAERNDVVVDLKEADRARLEILADELRPVFDQVPLDDQRFDFAISSGLQPRLWIDATAHVMMGRDRRTYRFVRDTRPGRIVLAESLSIEPIVDRVTLYIAERLHEREMAFAADELVSYRPAISQRAADADDGVRQRRSLRERRARPVPAEPPIEADVQPRAVERIRLRKRRVVEEEAEAPEPRDPNAIGSAGWAALGALIAFGLFVLALRDQLL